MLARQVVATQTTHPPHPFLALLVLQVGSHPFAQVNLNNNPPTFSFPHSWYNRHMPPPLDYLLRQGVTNFLLELPSNCDLPISTSYQLGLQVSATAPSNYPVLYKGVGHPQNWCPWRSWNQFLINTRGSQHSIAQHCEKRSKTAE